MKKEELKEADLQGKQSSPNQNQSEKYLINQSLFISNDNMMVSKPNRSLQLELSGKKTNE